MKALDGVDFHVKAWEFAAIIGKSGSGKSTLLHMIGGLDVPTDGDVIVDGNLLSALTKEQQKMCQDNPDIAAAGIAAVSGYVSETPKDHTPDVGLIWADNVFFDTIMKPLREQTKGRYPQKANEVMVTKEALAECGFEDLAVGDSFPMTYHNALGTH